MLRMNELFYALLLLFVVWLLYKQFAPVKGVRNLSAKEFQEESKGEKIIDVREKYEFKRGHIPGAVNIPLNQLSGRIGEIPKDKTVYLYCQSGIRSKHAARVLLRNGYTHIASLKGGISSWNGPVKK